MRARLIVVFLVPLVTILAVLGGAFLLSSARGLHQEFSRQQIDDLGYFLTGSRQALQTANPAVVEGEMRRYGEVFGARIAVIDRGENVLASSGRAAEQLVDASRDPIRVALSGRRADPVTELSPWASGDLVVAEPVFEGGTVIGAVVIGESLERTRHKVLMMTLVLLLACLVLSVALLFVASRLATWVLRPMHRVDRAMALIEQGNMNARIDDDTGPPETREMIGVFNRMADEIERVITRQQEFAANASHELRNPLGALMLRVEYLATGLDASWEPAVNEAREEGQRMARILETLLSLARNEETVLARTDLVSLVRDRAEAWAEVGADQGITLTLAGLDPVACVTDRTSVETALDTVIDNAYKYSAGAAGGHRGVTLAVRDAGDAGVITVQNCGRALTEEELLHMSDRFWRSNHDRDVAGTGLGLTVAHQLMDAIGGSLELSAPATGGLIVGFRIPKEAV